MVRSYTLDSGDFIFTPLTGGLLFIYFYVPPPVSPPLRFPRCVRSGTLFLATLMTLFAFWFIAVVLLWLAGGWTMDYFT